MKASRIGTWRNAWLPGLVALLGVIVSLAVAGAVRNYNQQQAQERFERHAERIDREVRQRFRLPLYGLQGAMGLHASSSELTLRDFRRFIAALGLQEAYPGIRGLGLIERVPSDTVAAYEDRINGMDAPDFKVHEVAPNTHAQRYVIRLIEPLRDNQAARGLDVGSEPMRRQAIERAVDSGTPTMTAPVVLVQDGRKSPGFLMFDPVYRTTDGAPPATPEARRAALDGVFYAPIVAAELLGTVSALADGLVDFELFAGTRNDRMDQLVFDSDGHLTAPTPQTANGRAFRITRQLDLLGEPYLLQLSSTARFDASAGGAVGPLTLLAGLVITALLTYMVQLTARGRERAESLARRMTQDLDRLANVAQRTSNAVVITDTERRITWVNEGFERMTGYSLQEAMGQSPGALLQTPDTDPAVIQHMREALNHAQAFEGEVLNRHKNGSLYWLRLEMQPLRDEHGKLNGFMAIESDITATKQAERALRDFNERMALAAISAGLGVWEIDMLTGTRIWDAQMYRLFGVDPTQAQPRPRDLWNRMLHPEDKVRIEGLLAAVMAGGPLFDTEFRIIWDDGSVHHLRGAAQTMRDARGQALRTIGLNYDITEKRQLEEELQAQNARLRSILEALPCGMSVFNGDLELVASNTEYRRLLGFPDQLFERQPPRFEDFIRFNAERGEYGTDDMEATVAAIVERARGTITPHRFERVRPGGIPLEIQGAPMPGGGFVTTYVDISERKQAELAIAQKEALLRGAIDAVNEAFVLYDPEDRLVFCNEKYRDLYAISADLIVPGARFEDLLREGVKRGQYPEADGQVEAWVAARVAQHRAGQSSMVQRLQDGRVVRVVERRMPDGHIVGFRIDITDLVRATETAEQASRSKSQFLANMSHEIRTPMNAILGMLALLQKTDLTPRQTDYAAKADGAARSLLGLLNDILDFSKVEAGKMALDPHPFQTESLLRDLGLILSMNTRGKPLEVLYDLDPALPLELVGDALRLQQVLVNLGGNAVKFTERGEVLVSFKLIERGPTDVLVEIAVTDTGIGIAPENQHKIFSGFTQAEADTTRRFGGTGLGLAISQRLVSLMGGELQLESTPGQGSRFHFRLRLGLPAPTTAVTNAPAHANVTTAPPVAMGRALVVDDNAVARMLVARMLQAMGWQVDTADGGGTTLEKLAAQEQDKPYDVAVIDWQMPDMDGWGLCKQIRERWPGSKPRLVMLTAHGHDFLQQRNEAELALLDAFLSKPVTPTTLRAALHTARGTLPRPQADGRARRSQMRLRGLNLLLAEDNPINQQVASELLRSEGAEVTVVDNGEEAVRAVAQSNVRWDTLLMDLQMPVMDGLTATRCIREDLERTELPIVAMTANAMPADREACLQGGMNEHVGKPFDLNQLVAVLRKVCGMDADPSASPTSPAAVPPAHPAHAARPQRVGDAAAKAGVVLEGALDRLGGRTDVYSRMLRSFVSDNTALRSTLITLAQQGDRPALLRQLHTLKGLARTLGMKPLADAALQAEEWTSSKGNLVDAGPLTDICALMEASGPHWAALAMTLEAQPTAAQATATSMATPEDTPAGKTAGTYGELRPQLLSLKAMLQQADMAATDLSDQLARAHQPAAGSELAALCDAVQALDFESALRHCDTLLAVNPGG